MGGTLPTLPSLSNPVFTECPNAHPGTDWQSPQPLAAPGLEHDGDF